MTFRILFSRIRYEPYEYWSIFLWLLPANLILYEVQQR